MMTTQAITGESDTYSEIPDKKELYGITLRMAWPAMLESFLISMTGFVDTIMVGTLGASAIAAVGLTDQPRYMGLSAFLAIATLVSSICARRKGENDRDSANLLLRKMLIFGTLLCIAISALLFFGADFIINLAGSQPDTHDDAVAYLQIIMLGLLFTTTTQIINAAQRGVGNTRISMLTNTVANIVNVIFNYLLIGGHLGFPALGIAGAALATVIGTAAGCAISIMSALNPAGFIYLGYRTKEKLQQRDIKSAIDIGSSAFIEQIFLRIGFFIFAITVAQLGTAALSAHTIAMKLLNISFSLADGLAIAAIALVGRSLGQKNPTLARSYGSICHRFGLACSVILSIIFTLGGQRFFMLFTSDPSVLAYADMLIALICITIYIQIVQVVTISCLRGAGDTKFTAFTSLISVGIVRPLASWVLCYPCGLGLTGIWIGLLIDQCIRMTFVSIRFKHGKWLTIRV